VRLVSASYTGLFLSIYWELWRPGISTAVVSGLERTPGGTIRVRAAFLDAVLDGKFDAGSAELTGPGAPSTKWCALR
jgi:hypothetical protein